MRHQTRREIFDVVVIGLGPAGCAAAVTLAREGLDVVAIHDRRKHPWHGESLPPGAEDLVSDVFGPEVLADQQVSASSRVAWESLELDSVDSISNPAGNGWLLDRKSFDRQCRQSVQHSGVETLSGHAQVQQASKGGWNVVAGNTEYAARWLIDASGRRACVARRNGALLRRADRLVAYLATVPDRGDEILGVTTEAVHNGWWYSLPGTDTGRLFGFITDLGESIPVAARGAWWKQEFEQTRYVKKLAPMRHAPGVSVVDASAGYLEKPTGRNWVAVGDAAAHFDPLSSQGLLTGILMGAKLGKSLAAHTLKSWETEYKDLVDEHLILRSHYYSLVTQFPLSHFWSRRIRNEWRVTA